MLNRDSALIVVNKPPGMTSRRVVDVVARAARPAKAGHAGTLDPLASGVLVVGIGQATRLVEYLQRMRKRYRGQFLFGKTSPSEDIETPLADVVNARRPTLAELTAACEKLVGVIQQRPPAYSAIKQSGRRAYALARTGHEVRLEPRPITIYSIRVVRFDYPELELDIECGAGTYIRSLGRDLAESLGTGAVMSALERTRIGEFDISEAVALERIDATNLDAISTPVERAVAELPKLAVAPADLARLQNGLSISQPAGLLGDADQEFAAFDDSGRLVAILVRQPGGALRPSKVFRQSSG